MLVNSFFSIIIKFIDNLFLILKKNYNNKYLSYKFIYFIYPSDKFQCARAILPYYIPQTKEDTTLVFESRFESGNLRRAIQICDYEYNVILKPDYYTTMNTQWFYFSLSNTRKDVEYRFNIINMMKPDSLYNSGMKPLMYSELGAKHKKIGWFRDGHEICYYYSKSQN